MPRGARLASYLGTAWAAVIVFASLYPFSGWTDPGISTISFISIPLPKHVLWGDFLINLSAYVPLGFLVSMAFGGRRAASFLLATLLCCLLSFSMESVQMYLPTRVASNLDWLANSLGGLIGSIIAMRANRLPLVDIHLVKWRDDWIIQGAAGDAGIALVALWLFTQTNPSLPLMGSWILDEGQLLQRLFIPHSFSFHEAASVALNLLSFGLLLSLMMKEGRAKLMPVVLTLLLAALIKSAMAGFLLKPSVFFAWASREALAGVGTGLALISAFKHGTRKMRVSIAILAIFAQIVFTILTPNIASPGSELFLFSWKYGQLLTLSGSTSFIARLWPYLALAYLGAIYRKV
jgi:VanZ family protein